MRKKLILLPILISTITCIFFIYPAEVHALEIQRQELFGAADWNWTYDPLWGPGIDDMCVLQLTSNAIRAIGPAGRERSATVVWSEYINTLESGWYKVELRVSYYYNKVTYYSYCYYYFYYNGVKFTELIIDGNTDGPEGDTYFSFVPYITANGKEIRTGQYPTFFHVGRDVTENFKIYKIEEKKAPEITLNNPVSGLVVMAEPGLDSFTVDGYVRDGNGDDITLTVEVAGVTRSQVITDTRVAKPFSFSFSALAEGIRPEGMVILSVHAADAYGKETKVTRTIHVKQRIRHDAYLLIDTPVTYETIYSDIENDAKYAESYKYIHTPTYFDNSMGLIPDSGIWRSIPYTSFSKSGLYEAVYRGQDEPLADGRFSDFRRWSSESLGMVQFKVHRPPVADFTFAAVPKAEYGEDYYYRNILIEDTSYDPDHQNEPGRGISERIWQYRRLGDTVWTDGKLSGAVYYTEKYEVRLKVRDIDGEGGKGVWSDWVKKTIDPRSTILSALFDVVPRRVSHGPRDTITILDKSVGDIREWRWTITDAKTGTELYYVAGNKTKFPASDKLKSWGIGTYNITLRVFGGTFSGTTSAPYTVTYEVINNPPEAQFTMPEEVYRDTVIQPDNGTSDYDMDDISYEWYLDVNGKNYLVSTEKEPQFKLVDIIKTHGISALALINGQPSLKMKATDSLGAVSYFTRDFTVLQHAPVASIIDNGNGSFSSGAYDEDSDDNECLIYKWKLVKPDGETEMFSTRDIQVVFDIEGDYILEHWVIDQIGVKSNTAVLHIDKLPPSVSAEPPHSTEWSSTGSSVKVFVTDASGVSTVKYRLTTETSITSYSTTLNANGQAEFVFQVPFAEEGIYYLHLNAVDVNGNTTREPLLFGPYLVDKTGPDIDVEYKSGARYVDGNNYWARQGDVVTFAVTGSDALSGIKSVGLMARDNSTNPYRIHGKSTAVSFNTHSRVKFLNSSVIDVEELDVSIPANPSVVDIFKADFPVEVITNENCAFGIEGIGEDNAGLSTGWVDSGIRLMIDNTPPVINISPEAYFGSDDITITISCSDTGSGIDYVLYACTLTAATPGDGFKLAKFNGELNVWNEIEIKKNGTWYVHVYAFDNVGNSSYKVSGPYEIHRNEPPEVSIVALQPDPIYEGDYIELLIQPYDADMEPLDMRIDITDSSGNRLYSYSQTVYPEDGVYKMVNHRVNRFFSIGGGYLVTVSVTDSYGKSDYDSRNFDVSVPDIESVTIEGYWNHWRGQKDIFGKQMTSEPHRFLSLETVKINVVTAGYADRVVIRFSPELESMRYADKLGHVYDYFRDFRFQYVTFPNDSTFYLDETLRQNRVYWEYTLPLAPSTKSWNDERLSPPYKMTVYVYKGEHCTIYEINDIDITGNVYDLVYIQPVNN